MLKLSEGLMFDSVTSSKVKMINVRLAPLVHDQFKIACELRGGSMPLETILLYAKL